MGLQKSCPHRPEKHLSLVLLCMSLVILAGPVRMRAATGYPNEISNLHVENIAQTSVDVVWDTVHPSTSQALLCRDMNYQPEIRVPWTVSVAATGGGSTGGGSTGGGSTGGGPASGAATSVLKVSVPLTSGVSGAGPMPAPPPGNGGSGSGSDLVTHHRVHVTGLRPYNSFYRFGTYYYYVASVDATGKMSTAPGPVDYATTSLPSFQTLPVDTNASQSFLIYSYGPTNVFAGSDLYFMAEMHQLGGSTFGTFTDVVNQTGVNNGSDGVVTGLTPATQASAGTISVHLACQENSNQGSDAGDQSRDFSHPGYYGCYTSSNVMPYSNFRLRTSASTVPGPYKVTFTYINGGVSTTGTYTFTVMSAPSFRVTPPTSFPAIPGRANWETQMVTLGHKWCDTHNGASRDDLNSVGNFLTGWGWTGDGWFYDGGRIYQQVDDYTANVLGQPNHQLWQHCALNIIDPYREYQLYNNAAMALYSVFPWGMEMNYLRTGNTDSRDAVFALQDKNGGAHYGGYIDWYSIRETSYMNNVRIASEMMGRAHSPLLDIGINKLLGDIDQIVNGGKVNTVHQFMVGIALQTLILDYEWNASQGRIDNRIPVAVKSALDALWTTWNPTHYSFAYNNTSLPADDSYLHGMDDIDWTDLNALVAPAYAWYWLKTGDATALTRGDLAFQHALDPKACPSWSGKEYSQIYQWTFDYVRWRSGENNMSTVFPSQNPHTGPYADTAPPIMGGAGYTKVTVVPSATGATITWNTYKPATTQAKYGITASYGSIVPLNQAPVTSHSVVINGLLPRTTYHFQPISVDGAGNVAALADQTFTTTP